MLPSLWLMKLRPREQNVWVTCRITCSLVSRMGFKGERRWGGDEGRLKSPRTDSPERGPLEFSFQAEFTRAMHSLSRGWEHPRPHVSSAPSWVLLVTLWAPQSLSHVLSCIISCCGHMVGVFRFVSKWRRHWDPAQEGSSWSVNKGRKEAAGDQCPVMNQEADHLPTVSRKAS